MKWVLFFDGDCGFCSRSVRLVARLDRRGRVDFAPLQGQLARQLGLGGHAASHGGSMVVWREPDRSLFTRSDALLELATALGGPWRLLCFTKFVPRRLRDAIYQAIADRRGSLPGGSSCALPDPQLARRMRH
jgi:predicted DCC family thiol-disulfide oxidoreductase YuxK